MKICTERTPIALGVSGLGQLAFDGCFYYFTLFCQEKILKTTTDFRLVGEFPTARSYDCLCYDSKAGCFWASIPQSATRLFQLDCQFQEIGCLCLHHNLRGKLTALAYHPCHHSLFLAFPCGLLEYNQAEETLTTLPPVPGLITACCVICPGYLLVTRQGKQQTLHSFFDTGEKIREYTLPHLCSLQSFLYNPCQGEVPHIDSIFTQQGCYPSYSKFPVTPHNLGFNPCICNHRICQHCCCDPCCAPEESLSEVLESIALLETALSCILNAQGESLQKMVAESDSLEEMLEANQQVSQTITKVTRLEQVLYCKLEALEQIQPCPPKPCRLEKNSSQNCHKPRPLA